MRITVGNGQDFKVNNEDLSGRIMCELEHYRLNWSKECYLSVSTDIILAEFMVSLEMM